MSHSFPVRAMGGMSYCVEVGLPCRDWVTKVLGLRF